MAQADFPYSGIGAPLPPKDDPRYDLELRHRLEGIDGNFQELVHRLPQSLFVVGTAKKWHYVGDPGEPTLNSQWDIFDDDTPGYAIDDLGIVHLRGTVQSNSVGAGGIFELPTGFRPAVNVYFAGGPSEAELFTVIGGGSDDGKVVANLPPSGTFISLGSAHFVVAD